MTCWWTHEQISKWGRTEELRLCIQTELGDSSSQRNPKMLCLNHKGKNKSMCKLNTSLKARGRVGPGVLLIIGIGCFGRFASQKYSKLSALLWRQPHHLLILATKGMMLPFAMLASKSKPVKTARMSSNDATAPMLCVLMFPHICRGTFWKLQLWLHTSKAYTTFWGKLLSSQGLGDPEMILEDTPAKLPLLATKINSRNKPLWDSRSASSCRHWETNKFCWLVRLVIWYQTANVVSSAA